MKPKHLTFLLLSVLSFFLNGCVSPMYLPTALQSPQFEEAGEVQVSVHGGTNGTDVQAAVAVTNYLMVLGAGSFGQLDSNLNRRSRHNHAYAELALGGYLPFNFGDFNTPVFSGNVGGVFEIIGGAGLGNATGEFITQTPLQLNDTLYVSSYRYLPVQSDYHRYLLQTNIGLSLANTREDQRLGGTRVALSVGFGLRFSNLRYLNPSLRFEASDAATVSSVNGWLMEGIGFARLETAVIRLELQYGVARALERAELPFAYQAYHLSAGIGLMLGGKRIQPAQAPPQEQPLPNFPSPR